MEHWQLKQLQALPLEIKIQKSLLRIREWYEHYNGEVYISFSGGKDSTVLLDLVRSLYPDVIAVFADTGLEYPEIREFVKSVDKVVTIRPNMRFDEVIYKHGYPVISKQVANMIRLAKQNIENGKETTRTLNLLGKRLNEHGEKSTFNKESYKYMLQAPFNISEKCCDEMKKKPFKQYEKKTNKKAFVGTMADESLLRKQSWIKAGCNAFDNIRPMSAPISFWKDEDIWGYLKSKNVPYSKIYDMGERRTGCMFCMFGVHLEKYPNRFQRMAKTHPKQYDYCINQLGCGKVLDFIDVSYIPGEVKQCNATQLCMY